MHSHRIVTLGPDSDPIWVCLYIRQIDEVWSAMLVADGMTPPAPGELKGLGFFAETAEGAEQAARNYLGMTELVN